MKDNLVGYELKELNKALNFAIGGLIGALIPIIGLILGLIALTSALSIKSSSKLAKSKRKITIAASVFAIIMSLSAGAGYYIYYRHAQQVEKQEYDNAQKIKTDTENKKKADEESSQNAELQRKAALQTCLSNDDSKYPWQNMTNDSKRDPQNSQTYLNLYYKIKNEKDNNCHQMHGY